MKNAFHVSVTFEKSLLIEDFISEHGTFFHQYDFLSAVGKEYTCVVAYSNDESEIVGVLPLVKSRKAGLVGFHIPPFAYQFGPVVSNKHLERSGVITSALLDAITSKHLDLKFKLQDEDLIPFKTSGFSITALQTHIFPSSSMYDISVLSKDKARDVRLLSKHVDSGLLSVAECRVDSLTDLLYLWKETSKRSKFNPHLETLERIFCSLFKQSYFNVIYNAEGIPVAGAFCPYDSAAMYHLIGAGSRPKSKIESKANILSLFMGVRWANQKGLDFDFEGSNIASIAAFYRMMGGRTRVLYRAQKSRSLYFHVLRTLKGIREEGAI